MRRGGHSIRSHASARSFLARFSHCFTVVRLFALDIFLRLFKIFHLFEPVIFRVDNLCCLRALADPRETREKIKAIAVD